MPTNTEDLQLIDQLPAAINIEMILLEQWCNENGWTNLHLASDFRIHAFPPNSYVSLTLPNEAFTKLEKIRGFLDELREVQSCKRSIKNMARLIIALVIACAVMIWVNRILLEAVNTLS